MKVQVKRMFTKMVFGRECSVISVARKEYKISNGEVCVKFSGRLTPVYEVHGELYLG